MSGIKDSENIKALRERLYERGNPPPKRKNHHLSHDMKQVPRDWQHDVRQESTSEPIPDNAPKNSISESPPSSSPRMSSSQPRKRYRNWFIGGGLGAFILSLLVASGFLLFGSNTISGANIQLSVSAPLTVAGGDVLPLQVGIQNNNDVPIETATLIVEYPPGTRADTKKQEPLFTERLSLEQIESGEVLNVPLRALVFGEENEEQSVVVSLEYRVAGSNALFFKEATPVAYRVGSAPLTIAIDAVEKISSGQTTDVVIDITSNSPTPLTNVVVRAEYPLGFQYQDASPTPTAGRNVWQFAEIAPNETVTITITGEVVGDTTESYALNFSVGTPSNQNVQSLTSVYAVAQTEFEIEDPFLDVQLTVAGFQDDEVVVEPGQSRSVNIDVRNTLPETIYDAVVEVLLSGNAISDLSIGPPNGFYDSADRIITWDISSDPTLEEMQPGDRFRSGFSFVPNSNTRETPQINMEVNVRARRVSEANAAESILGSDRTIVRVATIPTIQGDANYDIGAFSNSGPVPPVAEETTTYTISWLVQNGTNDLTNAEMVATVPTAVTWLATTDGAGSFSYEAEQRQIRWNVGDVAANATVIGSFQVSIRPSQSQIGIMPNLVDEQQLSATDTFTNTSVRSTSPAISTELSTEAGYSVGNGRVQPAN